MTIPTFTSFQVTSLREVTFIGGTYTELHFDVYDESENPLDISAFTYTWLLCPYGQPSIISLTKTGYYRGDIPTHNRFSVYLYSGDTENLSGKYIQQPVLIGNPGYEFRLGQGYINIITALGA